MIASRIAMALLILAGVGMFSLTARNRWKLMFAARAAEDRSDRPSERIRNVLVYMFGQKRMFRYRAAGIAHAFIFIGFVVLALRTLVLFARGFASDPGFGFWLFDDDALLGAAYLFLKDVIGVFVVAGVAYFLYTRIVTRPPRMSLSGEGVFILCMIMGIIVSDLFYEASGYIRSADAASLRFHPATPAASVVAFGLQSLPVNAIDALYSIGFWMHAIIVLAFLNFLPYGKHFHVLTVLPNVYTSNLNGIGRLRPIPDIEGKIERGEPLGVKTVRQLSWKDVLDFYTCTECGRCTDHCPAANTGKLLSPKHLTIELRNHLYMHGKELSRGGRSAENPGPAHSESGEDDRYQLAPHIIHPEALWACTTCGACEQECPVFISYVDKIVDMRRNLVMEQGVFPDQLQNAFRGLETVANPYSFANEQRADWAAGLGVPLRSEKPDAEYLFWVGCAPSFDDRSRKIARATALLMKEAGVDFAILGPEEMCTGDPARRAGNEYLFETLAKQNVETMSNYAVRRIVTTCPHCFNTLANEYPQFGGKYEVIHHSVFLHQLIEQGRLKPTHAVNGRIAYHDSCYLGRYNGVYSAPREILKRIPGLEVVDAPESRDRGMCCGAGGAQMWKEEEPVRRETSREGNGKVNLARTRQLLRVLPNAGQPRKIATACPFCKTMLSDGLTDQGHVDVEQKDVAEFLLASVQGATPPATPS